MRRGKRRNFYGISMINLIDIIFMLLIFFMITTTFKQTGSFDINLPKSEASFSDDKNISATIFYSSNEEINLKIENLQTFKFSLDEFEKSAKNLNLTNYNSIHLSADESLDYGKIINLITILKQNSVENINLDIEKF